MKLFAPVFIIIFITASCSNISWKSNDLSNEDKEKASGLEIIMKADNTVTLPQLDGIKVFLQNNSKQTIKIWEPVNPSGLLEVYFLFDNGINEKLLIEPIILNWRSDFSKVMEIEPGGKIKLNTHITHWNCNDSELENKDFSMEGKLKACYSVKNTSKEGNDLWKGEIFSKEVLLVLKHHVIADIK